MHLIAPITSTSVILMVCIIVGIIAPVISAKSKIVHKSIAIIIISCTSFVGCRHTRSKPDMSMTTNAAYDSVRRNTMTATVGETGPSMNPRPYINFIPMYETIDPVYDEITTVKPVYSGHLGTQQNCPDYRGVLISEVHLYTFIL